MENKTPNFLLQLQTNHDRDSFVASLKLVIQDLYKNQNVLLEKIVADRLSENLAEGFLTWIRRNGPAEAKPQELATRCQDLIAQAESLPGAELTLAYSPSPQQTEKIVSLVRKKFSPEAIVNLSLDDRLIGGATISFQGKYYDQSLSHVLDQTIDKYHITIQKLYD